MTEMDVNTFVSIDVYDKESKWSFIDTSIPKIPIPNKRKDGLVI